MITGKEALIALANDEEVEFENPFQNFWVDIKSLTITEIEGGYYVCSDDDTKVKTQFRLKPRTIKINEIEVPACGVDYKPHTFMFVLNSLEPCEYSKIILDESDEIPPYWWRTEEEIKQVVAALRSIFK